MPRRVLITAALTSLVAAATLPAAAGAGPRYVASKWTSVVKVTRCSRVLDEAVFHGKMRRVEDSKRMAMRFTLLERTGTEGFLPVPAPKLGRWHRSRLDVGGFGYKQSVRNLAAGSVYSMRVDYRWYDEDGKVVKRARKRSASCPNPTALPNLRVRIVGVRKTTAEDTDRYFVKVMNAGQAPAGNVPVTFSVDGVMGGSATVPLLYAKSSKVVSIRAPECEGFVEAVADPDESIAETSELDNGHQLACQDLKKR
jgi:CARDB